MKMTRIKQLFIRNRSLILIVLTVAFVLPEVTVYFSRPARGADIFGYLGAGSDALKKAPLYEHSLPGKNNTWPPLFSFFIAPLSLSAEHLGIPVTKELWYFFNFLCLIGVLQLWSEMLYGSRPRFCAPARFDFSSPKVFVPFLLLIPPFVNNFFMLQINVFVLFLVSLGFSRLIKKRPVAAGLCFGLAAALKAFPAVILLYLLVKREWKTSVSMALAGLLLSLLPVTSYGIDNFMDLFRQWLSISLFQPLIIENGGLNNQSLYAMWYRLLVYQGHCVAPTSLAFKIVTTGSIAAVIIATMSVFVRKKFDADSPSLLIEAAAVCIMMNLFSPIAWIHHFVFLYPAAAVAWWAYGNGPLFFKKNVYRYVLGAWSALILLPYVFTKIIGPFFKACSNYTLSALLLLLFLLVMAALAQKQHAAQENVIFPKSN
ncbi:MAG: DUF2029 domain-containing protein [Chitinispirillaceae bacterium]|nr:DUF2029 domain-containing protein [Chitinispirillaceae bacterium]